MVTIRTLPPENSTDWYEHYREIDETARECMNSSSFGREWLRIQDAAAARVFLGVGTSSLQLGTTSTTAKRGDWLPTTLDITDATALGRTLLTSSTNTAARTALGAASSSHTHPAAQVSDFTAAVNAILDGRPPAEGTNTPTTTHLSYLRDTAAVSGANPHFGTDATQELAFAKANMDALNALVTSLGTAGGGCVVIDRFYSMSGSLKFASNVDVVITRRGELRKIDNDTSSVFIARGQNVSNFRLMGEGLITAGSQTNTTASIQLEGCSNVFIGGGLRLQGTKRSIRILPSGLIGSKDITIDTVDFNTVTDIAVDVSGGGTTVVTKNITVRNVHVTDVLKAFATAPYTAFYFQYVDGGKIENSVVENSYDTAAMLTHCNNVTVTKNTFNTNMVTVYVGQSSTNCAVTHNELSSYTDFGIAFHDNAGDTSIGRSLAAGNRIHDCGKSGIAIEAVRYITAVYNVIWNCGQRDGTQPSKTTAGSTVSVAADTQRAGIYTETLSTGGPEGGKPEYLVITNNIISDTTGKMKYGVRLAGTDLKGAWVDANAVTPGTGFIKAFSYVEPLGTGSYVQGAAPAAGGTGLVIGTTSTTAKAGDWKPTAADITDSTATGRSVLTAATAAAARTALGVTDRPQAPMDLAAFGVDYTNTVTSQSTQLQAAFDSLASDGRAGIVELPPTLRIGTPITVKSPNVTVRGGGRLLGSGFIIKSPVDTTPLEMNFMLTDVTIDLETITTGRHGLVFGGARTGFVDGVRILNADHAVHFDTRSVTQHTRRIQFGSQNRFHNGNVAFYAAQFSASHYGLGDIHIDGMQTSAFNTTVQFAGVDGVLIDGITSFQREAANRGRGIDIDYTIWTKITGCNLFESGAEAIRLSRFQNTTVQGNRIAWPGQVTLADGILLEGGDNDGFSNSNSIVADNLIEWATKNGIYQADLVDGIKYSGNVIIDLGRGSKYFKDPNPALLNVDDAANLYTKASRDAERAAFEHFAIRTPAKVNTHSGGGNTARNTATGMDPNTGLGTRFSFAHTGAFSPSDIDGRSETYANFTPSYTLAADATTIDGTKGFERVHVSHTAPTTITAITAPVRSGAKIKLISFSANTTIQHSATLDLATKANTLMPSGGTIDFIYASGLWREYNRSWSAAGTVDANAVMDIVGPGVVAGNEGIIKAYDAGLNTLTLSVSQEYIEDRMNASLIAGANITKTYDDVAGTVTLSATAAGTAGLDLEGVQDAVSDMLVMGSTGITRAYDDVAGTLTLTLSLEYLQDSVSTMLLAGPGVTKTYDDPNGKVTIGLTALPDTKVYRTVNGTGDWPTTRPSAAGDVLAIGISPGPTWLLARDTWRRTKTAVA